jgi:hypothetical protein
VDIRENAAPANLDPIVITDDIHMYAGKSGAIIIKNISLSVNGFPYTSGFPTQQFSCKRNQARETFF